jgi:type VI secretion system protein ImpK
MALSLEEILTVICRIRGGQNVGRDADQFRDSAKHWLANGARKGQAAGYAEDSVIMAGYATVAFLDESVLNSQDPMFNEWKGRPLQTELFGDFLGGERFFRNFETILRMDDTEETADLLEVHLLCLALGFRGEYGPRGPGGLQELRHLWHRGRDKLISIRGGYGDLSPSWSVPAELGIRAQRDSITRVLALAAGVAVLLFGGLWVWFYLALRGGGAGLLGGT